MNNLEKLAFSAIEYSKMLASDTFCGNIVVAVSGGADSVALLLFLFCNKIKLNINTITVAHINHGLRAEADSDASFVENLCKKLNLPFFLQKVDVLKYAQDNKISIEESGRQLRYDFLENVASTTKSIIATAHTLSDNAETVLFNITRGAGLAGASGIPPVRVSEKEHVPIIRPLISCSRTDVENYCKEKSLVYVEDTTNCDVSFSRNRIRHNILPELEKINPAAQQKIFSFSKNAREDEDFLNSLASKELIVCKICDAFGGYDSAKLSQLATPILKRVLAQIIKLSLPHFSATERILSLTIQTLDTDGKVTLDETKNVECAQGRLQIVEKCNIIQNVVSQNVTVGQTYPFNQFTVSASQISSKEYAKNLIVHKNLLKTCFDYGKLKGTLVLRSRQSGDNFKIAGHNETKTLKKLFIEKKIPMSCRQKIPILSDDEGVIWIYQIGIHDRVSIDADTVKIFKLEIQT